MYQENMVRSFLAYLFPPSVGTTWYIIFHTTGDARPWNPGIPTQKLMLNLKDNFEEIWG